MLKPMPQSVLRITERITRPTAAKAAVTGAIRVGGMPFENERFEGWVSWVRSSLIHCCDCVS